MTDNQTKPQVALVTGATRGIGAAIAQELASKGYQVIGTATSDAGAEKITQALSAFGGRGVTLNVTDGAAVDALIDSIVKNDGGLHVLVNNAGITRDTLAM
ncbi:MAG: SDR family NAD(P)-dependent oxidoreductase, partial [Comamonas sp.]